MEDKCQIEWATWQRFDKAVREGDKEEASRIAREVEDAISREDIHKRADETRLLIKNAIDNIWQSKRQPDLAICVLATMNELKEIGFWKGEKNSSYELATKALQHHSRAEKKQADYRGTRKAFENVQLEELAINLIHKFLSPFQNDTHDPLWWFLDSSRVVDICKEMGVELTIHTLRKYQSRHLVPRPIRLGRKAHYSLLTPFRVCVIDDLKKHGAKLADIKEAVNDRLKAMLNGSCIVPPQDRSLLQDACVGMTYLTNIQSEKIVQLLEQLSDYDFAKLISEDEEQ